MIKKYLLAALIIPLLLGGCSTRLGNFTILSTKNTELGKKYVRVSSEGKASGVDSRSIIVIIPTGIPNIQEATDKALEKYGAQVLTDVVIYYDYYWIPYIYGEMKYRVEGDAWKKVDDLSGQVDKDLQNAKQIFTLKEINGKSEFVPVAKNDVSVENIH